MIIALNLTMHQAEALLLWLESVNDNIKQTGTYWNVRNMLEAKVRDAGVEVRD